MEVVSGKMFMFNDQPNQENLTKETGWHILCSSRLR